MAKAQTQIAPITSRTAGPYTVFETTLFAAVNIDLLKDQLAADSIIGSGYVNAYVDSSGLRLTVMINSPEPANASAAIAAVVAAHNPGGKSRGQQKQDATDAARGSLVTYIANPNPTAKETGDALKALIMALGMGGEN